MPLGVFTIDYLSFTSYDWNIYVTCRLRGSWTAALAGSIFSFKIEVTGFTFTDRP